MHNQKLLELAERLIAGTGKDRKLDWSIDQATCNSSIHSDHLDRFPDAAKDFTSSLDAAISLHPSRPTCIPSDPRIVSAQALRRLAGVDAGVDPLAILEKVKSACLYGEDDGTTGVTDEPYISPELFGLICDATRGMAKAA